eukprot:15482568-Alexandrium_andersonii.AAC.1
MGRSLPQHMRARTAAPPAGRATTRKRAQSIFSCIGSLWGGGRQSMLASEAPALPTLGPPGGGAALRPARQHGARTAVHARAVALHLHPRSPRPSPRHASAEGQRRSRPRDRSPHCRFPAARAAGAG